MRVRHAARALLLVFAPKRSGMVVAHMRGRRLAAIVNVQRSLGMRRTPLRELGSA